MPIDYDPSQTLFDPQESGRPLIEAVQQLADDVQQPFEHFVGQPLSEIAAEAYATYDKLPEFWRIWQDWHAPQRRPEMGDL